MSAESIKTAITDTSFLETDDVYGTFLKRIRNGRLAGRGIRVTLQQSITGFVGKNWSPTKPIHQFTYTRGNRNMQTVYIWDNHEQTGHASLLIDPFGEEELYLSWHPPVRSTDGGFLGALLTIASAATNMDGYGENKYYLDAQKMGYPRETIEFERLDEESMINFVRELYDNRHDHYYNLIWENCSHTVAHCLIKGFGLLLHDLSIPEHVRYEWVTSLFSRMFPRGGVHSHLADLICTEIPMVATRFRGAARSAEYLRAMAGSLAMIPTILWTPDNVSNLAHFMKSVEDRHS